jgi:hypothetical protein
MQTPEDAAVFIARIGTELQDISDWQHIGVTSDLRPADPGRYHVTGPLNAEMPTLELSGGSYAGQPWQMTPAEPLELTMQMDPRSVAIDYDDPLDRINHVLAEAEVWEQQWETSAGGYDPVVAARAEADCRPCHVPSEQTPEGERWYTDVAGWDGYAARAYAARAQGGMLLQHIVYDEIVDFEHGSAHPFTAQNVYLVCLDYNGVRQVTQITTSD